MKLLRFLTFVALFACALSAGETAKSQQVSLEIELLKKQLAEQQQQIDELRRSLLRQNKERETATESVISETPAQVASIVPYIPSTVLAKASPIPLTIPVPRPSQAAASSPSNPCETAGEAKPPAFIHIGDTCLIPVGFMDLTAFWRDKNAASGIGSNFGGVPFNNVTAGKLSEFRFSPQNSRIGFRFDGNWKGAHFIGYNEFDFLGTPSGNNAGVTNGAFIPRLRLFWVDVRKDNLEVLAGQSWSMLTPNRKGISALPGDIFFSQTIDVNYMAGLTWTRQAGVRLLLHGMSDKFTAGVSFENPDQYIGGSGGFNAAAVTLPAAAALNGIGGTQADNASNVLNTPNVHPDIIAKVAFDPSSKFHFEVGGIERTFKIYNAATRTYSTKAGSGVLLSANGEIAKGLRLITSNFWGDGGGRYLFGQAPDFILRADGAVSPVHSGGTVDGLELTVKNTLLYGYYGGIYIGRNTALDANGTSKIGYGFAGSPNTNNRDIQEITFGFNHTLWRSPRYGAINAMGQYEYLLRGTWAVLANQPKATHDSTIYFNLRYTLPGVMPAFK